MAAYNHLAASAVCKDADSTACCSQRASRIRLRSPLRKKPTWYDISQYRNLYKEQEAKLTLRNRASTTHFFVAKLLPITVMTYSYVYHLRNLRTAHLLRTQRINFSMRPQDVRMTRDPTVV